jgi:hypothetical protein
MGRSTGALKSLVAYEVIGKQAGYSFWLFRYSNESGEFHTRARSIAREIDMQRQTRFPNGAALTSGEN